MFRTFEIFSNLGSVNKLKEAIFTIPGVHNIRTNMQGHYATADTTKLLPVEQCELSSENKFTRRRVMDEAKGSGLRPTFDLFGE